MRYKARFLSNLFIVYLSLFFLIKKSTNLGRLRSGAGVATGVGVTKGSSSPGSNEETAGVEVTVTGVAVGIDVVVCGTLSAFAISNFFDNFISTS